MLEFHEETQEGVAYDDIGKCGAGSKTLVIDRLQPEGQ
jgi:hypothetical protein